MSNNLIPFNLEAALAGAKLVSRDGRAVTDFRRRTSDCPYGYGWTGMAAGCKINVTRDGLFMKGKESRSDLYLAEEWPRPEAEKWEREKKAFAEGKRIQCCAAKDGVITGTWILDNSPDWTYSGLIFHIHPDDEPLSKPWSLAAYLQTIPGWTKDMTPHRDDFTEEMLAGGWRPVLAGEILYADGEHSSSPYRGGFIRGTAFKGKNVDSLTRGLFWCRTKRPITPAEPAQKVEEDPDRDRSAECVEGKPYEYWCRSEGKWLVGRGYFKKSYIGRSNLLGYKFRPVQKEPAEQIAVTSNVLWIPKKGDEYQWRDKPRTKGNQPDWSPTFVHDGAMLHSDNEYRRPLIASQSQPPADMPAKPTPPPRYRLLEAHELTGKYHPDAIVFWKSGECWSPPGITLDGEHGHFFAAPITEPKQPTPAEMMSVAGGTVKFTGSPAGPDATRPVTAHPPCPDCGAEYDFTATPYQTVQWNCGRIYDPDPDPNTNISEPCPKKPAADKPTFVLNYRIAKSPVKSPEQQIEPTNIMNTNTPESAQNLPAVGSKWAIKGIGNVPYQVKIIASGDDAIYYDGKKNHGVETPEEWNARTKTELVSRRMFRRQAKAADRKQPGSVSTIGALWKLWNVGMKTAGYLWAAKAVSPWAIAGYYYLSAKLTGQ